MARELALILRDQTPLRVLLRFLALNVEPANFVPSKFIPEHLVCQVKVKLIALGIAPKQICLCH
jgi:hypothetical protein